MSSNTNTGYDIPQSQRAWNVVRKGPPSNALKLVPDALVPAKLERGEVLVKVQAAALNPVGYKTMELLPGFVAKKPYTPEQDLAGVIVDANGSSFSNGDEVFGFIPVELMFKTRQGALTEYTRMPADHLAIRPSNVKPTEAAGITLACKTAYKALFGIAKLEPGQSVFVNGGSSAVGAFAIQLAKAKGCKVTASASGKNEKFVREMGADEFVDYTQGSLPDTLSANPPSPKFHVFFEAVGLLDPTLYTRSPAYLAPDGVFISTGPQPKNLSAKEMKTTAKMVWEIFLRPTWLGGTKRKWKLVAVQHDKEVLDAIAGLLAEGKLKPIVDSVYPFEDVLKAFERLMTGRATGKVVVKVDATAA